MRFIILSLFVGLALGSPIGEVSEDIITTALPVDRVRDDIDTTTVIVEILADEGVGTDSPATERARQAATGEDGSEEEDEATTVASGGIRRPTPAIPQPFANASNFLAEYQYSQQFSLGPKDENLPLIPISAGAANVEPQIAASGAGIPQSAAAPVAANPQGAPVVPPASPAIATEDESQEVESDEATEAPVAPAAGAGDTRAEQPQRVEESDSDNEIANDDVTTVKSFASEYEYTVQQLDNRQQGETENYENYHVPSSLLTLANLMRTNHSGSSGDDDDDGGAISTSGLDDLDFETGILSDGDGRAACECGRLPFRVPLGEEAQLNLTPWSVAIVRGGLVAGGRPHCAGVLINDRYVLTSASCFSGVHPSGLQVWLTAHSTLDNHQLTLGTSKINVLDIVMHPNYSPGSKDNDIALLKMSQPVDISTSSTYFTPVCLPAVNNFDYSGRSGTIFGWGYGRINRICYATVPILDNGVCKRDSRHGGSITDNMMCAGYLTPGAPVRTEDCIGDAGGPLTVQISGRTSLIGITSWGYEHQNRGHTPTVYTRVAAYADWILHNTEDADWCSA